MATEFSFDVESDRKLNNMLEGERFQAGEAGPDSTLTTDTAEDAELRRKAIEEPEPDVDEDAQRLSELEYLKKQLGRQGQELGELRKTAKEAEIMRMRVSQLEQLAAQVQQANTPVGNIDIFTGIPQDQSYMSPLEKQRLNQVIAAVAQATQSELERVRNEANYTALRSGAGVSDADEAEILAEYPWISSLNGRDKATAIAQMAKARREADEAPKKTADEAARLAARRSSFVESGSKVSSAPDESMQSAAQKLLRDIDSGKFKNAKEIEAKMRKIGIGRLDDFGRAYR